MRLALTLPLLAALALPLTGCFDRDDHKHKHGHGHCNGHDDDDPAPTNTADQLSAGQWVYIESANGVETYRPQSPGGWVRNTYVFAADGTLTAIWAGPNDAPVSAPGTWSQKADEVTITVAPTATLPTRTIIWHVRSLSATELKITR